MTTDSVRGGAAGGEPIDFGVDAPVGGSWDVRWLHGRPSRKQPSGPPLQVHRYDPHTVIIRQSKVVSFEAPFLYLLFGSDRAILFDTGATADAAHFPIRATVDGLVEKWLQLHPREHYELVVAHTHGHRDHTAGDGQFAGRPGTTVVGLAPEEVQAYFGFSDWPRQIVPFDLGGRVLQVTGIPGHHPASIAVYDPWTGFLLTGDTVYPGRLYVQDYAAFTESLDRLVALAETRRVTYVLGCHIEMTDRPGRDYPVGCRYQPHEAPLPMTVAQLLLVRDAAHAIGGKSGAFYFNDFAIVNGQSFKVVLGQLLRAVAYSLRPRPGS